MAQDYASRGFVTIEDYAPPVEEKSADFVADPNKVYLVDHATPATQIVCTLPTTGTANGDTITFVGKGNTGGFRVAQETGVRIFSEQFGDTTEGTGGYMETEGSYQSITLRCFNAGADNWAVECATGFWVVN